MKLLQQEMDEWKSKELLSFEKTLKDEREKMQSRELKNIETIIMKNANESLSLAAKFASRFLKKFADGHLEKKIIDNFLTEFAELPKDKLELLESGIAPDKDKITIQSAYPIEEARKKCLMDKLQKLLGTTMNITFSQNSDLIAGLSIQIGALFLQANLRDELKFFAEIEYGSPRN